MGGLVGGLFGSKGTPSQIIDTTPEAFANLAGPVAQGLTSLFSSGGGPAFPGPFSAPLGGQEQTLLGNIFGQVQQPGAGAQAAMPLLQQIISGQFMSPQSNPFLAQSIASAQRPILEQFQEQVMPRLQAEFTRAGQFIQPQGSSPFDRSSALASRGLANALGDVSTNLTAENFAAERARQLPAAQLAAGLDAQQLQSTLQGLQAAALPRMIEDLGIERGMQEFQRRVQVLLQALGAAGTLAQPQTQVLPGTPGQAGQAGSLLQGIGSVLPFLPGMSGGGGGGGGIGSALSFLPGMSGGGGGATGGGGGSSTASTIMSLIPLVASFFMGSDRRLKSDIRRVGALPNGIGVYTYTMGGEETLGVMADEVAQVRPEAVRRGADGYLRVDYGRIL